MVLDHPPGLEDLLKVPYVDVGGAYISPQGTALAFSWNQTGQWEIYQLRAENPEQPQSLTQGPGAKLFPHWSPDGQSLAYLLDLDGSEQYEIVRVSLLSGESQRLTPNPKESIQAGIGWSPDSQWIAFTGHLGSRYRVSRVPVDGGPVVEICSLPRPGVAVEWSPDGRWLAVTLEGLGQDFQTLLVAPDGSQSFSIEMDGEPICVREVCWSPDSQRLAFSSDWNGWFDIGIFNLADRQIQWMTTGAGDKASPAWSPDGQLICFIQGDGPTSSLAVLNLDTAQLILHSIEPGVCSHSCFSASGNEIDFVFESPRHPPDLWQLNLAACQFRRLTCSLPAEIDPSTFILPTPIEYSGPDGKSVPAILYRPPSTQGENIPPAVIYIHGGPDWLTQIHWDPLLQSMARRGWVVLAPNYRGSTGYGRAWQYANRFDLGGADAQDILCGADYLINLGLADPERIAVTGRSYGGYLTMVCLTRYPDRWKAGSAVVPFLNWFTSHENARLDLQVWNLENLGDPVIDHDRYAERSPYFYLDRIDAPVQLICGANDPRCPASESIQACQTLTSLGKECELVLYDGEGHVFLKIDNVIDHKLRCIAFLAKALGEPG